MVLSLIALHFVFCENEHLPILQEEGGRGLENYQKLACNTKRL